jgi:SAM-dependent methyltransferase
MSGSVLELACGSGIWTQRLAPRARRLVAVDSSSGMIELNRGRFGAANVEYVHADVFTWEPGERFDAALTGFFISHIPPDRFARFWERLATWLEPGGRLFLIEDAAGAGRPYSGDAVQDGPAFAHRRQLADGREYTIVKRFFTPGELTDTLDALGWDADIRASGEHLLFGTASPR